MISVAIDGPAGAGKSTIARAVSAALGFIYIDTGAMYRSIGYYVMSKDLDTKSDADVCSVLGEINIRLKFENGEQHVYLNGEDVSGKIRSAEVSMAASDVSRMPPVREFLLSLQRSFAEDNNVIMDGRDIGTVVLPNAKLKIFLTASPESRAKRRYDEMVQKGDNVRYEDVLSDLKQRDYNDSHREISPLKPADDGVIVDTTELSLQESIQKIVDMVKNISR